jgi:AcrR family transcriptional regulator
VARYGIRKTTMVDVASKSGVAKATLYNHFRTKDDVLAALVEQQLSDLIGACVTTASADGLAVAFAHGASEIGSHPSLRKAAEDEQSLLAPLATPSDSRGWQAARAGVAAVLTAGGAPSGPVQVELVLRWYTSQVLWPLTREQALSAAEALVVGLGGVTPSRIEVPSARQDTTSAVGALGWPA